MRMSIDLIPDVLSFTERTGCILTKFRVSLNVGLHFRKFHNTQLLLIDYYLLLFLSGDVFGTNQAVLNFICLIIQNENWCSKVFPSDDYSLRTVNKYLRVTT